MISIDVRGLFIESISFFTLDFTYAYLDWAYSIKATGKPKSCKYYILRFEFLKSEVVYIPKLLTIKFLEP